MDKYRVAKCKETQKPVLQVKETNGWLCMHKETELEDTMQVEAFRAGRGY